MKIVELDWIDAWHTAGEMTAEEAKSLKPMRRKSVGYLLHQSESVYVIASGFIEKCGDGIESYCDFDVIPIDFVTSMGIYGH